MTIWERWYVARERFNVLIDSIDLIRWSNMRDSVGHSDREAVQATCRLVSDSRFETAIAELCRNMEVGFAEHTVALTELRRDMKVGFAKQAAAFAEAKTEIYRYLWVWGGLLVAVLSSLYMLAETWSRG